ncbi:DUF1461 domain-containing protein [Candidatus Dojkabacteria bacterium]|uniref:DUF1461 domain-containing protein n=1 Tax=Candidatus Dojkabacteria bacterium TaxID=2099670 RepID=A0A952AGI2_9BACT|nr:DUF1461 domain-containing protein [Candidatus Dojkabacteria bacterium]
MKESDQGKTKAVNILISSASLFIALLILPPLIIIKLPQYFFARFSALNVYDNFPGLNHAFLNSKFQEILMFVHNSNADFDISFFSVKDYLHMLDVSQLTIYAHLVLIIALITFLLNLLANKSKALVMIKTSVHYLLALFFVLAIITSLLFRQLFIIFHQISFSNDYWLLDPKRSMLIRFLPEEVFEEIVVISILSTISLLVIIYFFVILRLQWIKKHENKRKY